MSPQELHTKADRCRNLAAGINDDEMIRRLLALAEDFDAQARTVEETGPVLNGNGVGPLNPIAD